MKKISSYILYGCLFAHFFVMPIRAENFFSFIASKLGFVSYSKQHKNLDMQLFEYPEAKVEDIDLLKALLDAGASINNKNKNGYTVLYEVINNGWGDSALLLLKRGALVDTTVVDEYGNSLLHLVVQAMNQTPSLVVLTKLLLNAGCQIDQRNYGSKMPLDLATNPEIIQVLLDAGAVYKNEKNIPLSMIDVMGAGAIKYKKLFDVYPIIKLALHKEAGRLRLQDSCITAILDIENRSAQQGTIPFAHGCPYVHGMYRYIATKLHNATHANQQFDPGYMMPRFYQTQTHEQMLERLQSWIQDSDYLFCQHSAFHDYEKWAGASPYYFFKRSYSNVNYIISIIAVLKHYISMPVIQDFLQEGYFDGLEDLYKATKKHENGLLYILEVTQEFAQNYMRYRRINSGYEKFCGPSLDYVQKGVYDSGIEHIIPVHALCNPEIVSKHVKMHVIGIDFTSPEWKIFAQVVDLLIERLLEAQEKFGTQLPVAVA